MPELTAAPVTLILLAANVVVSLYALFSDQSLIDRLSFRPRPILENGEYYRMITAGFIHGGLMHLAFNMYALYLFGPVLEVILGPVKFLIVYFGAELAAHGLTLVLHKNNPNYAAVGASGAVSGIVFGFCLFYPNQGLGLIFIPIFIPAYLFALLYVGFSIFAMRRAQEQGQLGGIAHEAHIGGAIGGLLLTVLLEPRAIPFFLEQVGL